MPPRTNRDIPRGASDPVFAPRVGIEPVSANISPDVNQLERLRDVLFAAGQSTATALALRGQDLQDLEARKRAALARQEAARNEAYRTLQQRRQEKAEALAQDLLLDRRAEDPRWVEQNAVIQWENAATPDERKLWFNVIQQAKTKRSALEEKEENRQRRLELEDINIAGVAAANVIAEAALELEADPAMQAELIGDGADIPSRVQNWAIGVAREASPDLFDISAEDPFFEEKVRARDNIVAHLVSRANGIADKLVSKHVENVEASNEMLAGQKMDAWMFDIQTGGETDVSTIEAGIREIDGLLGHMPQAEKRQFLQQMTIRGVEEAANMTFTEDYNTAFGAMQKFLLLSNLTEADRARVLEAGQAQLLKTAVAGYSAHVNNALNRATSVQTPAHGIGGVQRIAATGMQRQALFAIPDENGENEFFRLAREYLLNVGIDDDRTDLSNEESALVDSVLQQAARRTADATQAMSQAARDEAEIRRTLGNFSGGNTRKMVESSPGFQSNTPEGLDAFARERLEAQISPDSEITLDQLPWGEGRKFGEGPVDQTPETRGTREFLWRATAGEVNAATQYDLEPKAVERIAQMFRSGDPEQMWNALSFYRGLNNKRKFLADFGTAERAGQAGAVAMTILNNRVAQAGPGTIPLDWENQVQEVNTILRSSEFVRRDERGRPAVDEKGQIITFNDPARDREVVLTQRGEALLEILAAIQANAALGSEIGVPEERSVVGRALGNVGFRALQITSAAGFVMSRLLGPDFFNAEGAIAENPSPDQVEAYLRTALGNFGETDLDTLLDVYFGLRAGGANVTDAAAGVAGFLDNAGVVAADLGSGPRLLEDPAGALGPRPMDPEFNRQSVEEFLDSPIPGDPLTLDSDFVRVNSMFPQGGKAALRLRDIPHRAHPNLFGDPTDPLTPPLEWSWATQEGNWLHNAQRGGLPLLFKTQDGNPRWIQILDPTTNNPLILYNYHDLAQPQADLDSESSMRLRQTLTSLSQFQAGN